MLKIRLSRIGKKNQPNFRIVVQEHTSAVKGKFIEALGYYRPAIEGKDLKINSERIKYWLSMGAKPSDSLAVLLKKENFEKMDQFIAPRNKKKKKKEESKTASVSETKKSKTEKQEPAKPAEPAKPEESKTEEPKPAIAPNTATEELKQTESKP